MKKLTLYRRIILGIGLIFIVVRFIFPENNIMSFGMIKSIYLICIAISTILAIIEFEIKQGKIEGKPGRYLMYISSVITFTGLVLAVNKVPYSKMVISIGLIGVVISMPLLFIRAEKKAEQGKTTGKLSRYLLYVSMVILMTGLLLGVNKVAHSKMVLSIGLIGLTTSMALIFINAEKMGKQDKTMGKLSRYLLYITFIIIMTGLLFKINKLAYSNVFVYIGLIAVIILFALRFINAKKMAKKNTSGGTE